MSAPPPVLKACAARRWVHHGAAQWGVRLRVFSRCKCRPPDMFRSRSRKKNKNAGPPARSPQPAGCGTRCTTWPKRSTRRAKNSPMCVDCRQQHGGDDSDGNRARGWSLNSLRVPWLRGGPASRAVHGFRNRRGTKHERRALHQLARCTTAAGCRRPGVALQAVARNMVAKRALPRAADARPPRHARRNQRPIPPRLAGRNPFSGPSKTRRTALWLPLQHQRGLFRPGRRGKRNRQQHRRQRQRPAVSTKP